MKINVNDNYDIKFATTVFLPYQVEWLNDRSQIKIWRKSRRIGATYVQAYEDVFDALTLKIRGKHVDVWFSSADITAAKEYIMYCAYWAKVFNIAVEDLGEIVIDEEKSVKALSLEFTNGARINALSSNPTQFRSKGGKIVLDEFAHHKDQQKLWTAAGASALVWGYPVRILSTDNGVTCKFYKFVKAIKKGKLKWSLHATTIFDAVAQGLADKVLGRELTDEERQEWLNNLKENAGDEITWAQEYCCQPVDENSALLSFEMIQSCQQKTFKPLEEVTGDLYVGMDVARTGHLSVIAVLEMLENVGYLRQLVVMKNTRWKVQEKILWGILSHPNLRRACIDATGIGDQIAERAQERFGKYRIEKNKFTHAFKEEIAMHLYTTVEDRNIRFEDEPDLTIDLHSMKRITSSSNVVRFDADKSETDGHGDRFIAIALANHAARGRKGVKAEGRSAYSRAIHGKTYESDFEPYRSALKRFCS